MDSLWLVCPEWQFLHYSWINSWKKKKRRECVFIGTLQGHEGGVCRVMLRAQDAGEVGRWERLHPLVRPWMGTVALAMGGVPLVYTTLGKICSLWARLKLPTLPPAERHSCTTGFRRVSVFCTLFSVPCKAMVIGLRGGGGGAQNRVGTYVELGLQSLEHLNPQSWRMSWPFGEIWTNI